MSRLPRALVLTIASALVAAGCSRSSLEASPSLESAKQSLSSTPYWSGGTGPAVTHPPVAWPSEPVPGACGATCGDWLPYTRFGNALNDPRTQDPSNGGTSPQSYVNIASSCTDKALPSIYYSLHKDPVDPSKDVILFRWRVAASAHTYASGQSPGSFRSSDPWSSALWTVLFNLDGSGYRQLAAHINGSSGEPSAPVDMLAGIYGKIPTQSVDYLDDPANIKLLGTSPTAFVDDGTDQILNFQNSNTPTASWPNGSAETIWDYGSTRARLVSTRPCTEYFIDYQIPVALLDATAHGGPKIDRKTPISMLFCTANSLNNPMQKDCALNRTWTASVSSPGPFGDFISFDQTEPYKQPIVSEVRSIAPASCAAGTYTLIAKVQDSLYVNAQGVVQPSVKEVGFWFYQDLNGDGVSNDGSTWTFAVNGTLVPGTLNEYRASWDGRALPKGSYLIGVQALDDRTLVDDGMAPAPKDNRTFSYVTSDSLGRVYVNGSWQISVSDFPAHSPAMAPVAGENWYGNPLVTGIQVSGTGIDVALNACGVSPILTMGATPTELAPAEQTTFTLTVSNAGNSMPVTVSSLTAELPSGFNYVTGSTSGPFGSANPTVSGNSLTWTFGPAFNLGAGASATLTFRATATSVAGPYNASASGSTSFGNISSSPVALTVYAAKTSLTQTPDRYLVTPDGTTQVTYTFQYANSSPIAVTNATLTNALPANVNFVGCTGGTSCALSSGTVTWQLGTLAAGATGTATLKVTLAPAYSATSFTNTATLSAYAPDTSLIQRTATSTIAVYQPKPSLRLSMSASVPRVAPAGSVTWTISYWNDGDGAATSALLVNTLPAGFTYSSCAVSGSTHFTACANNNGVVTFSGAGGAGVNLPISGTGSVTVTATAAAAPFTFPNPAVNSATLTASGGSATAQAQSSVGVTGDYCQNVFYFHRGADNLLATVRPANTTQPSATANYSTAVANITATAFASTTTHTDQIVFLQETAFSQAADLSGLTATIDFNLGATQGGAGTRVVLENASSGATIATSSEISITNGQNWYTYTVTVPAATTVSAGQKLRWVFQFRKPGGTRDITFYYDSTTYKSRSSFCTTASPAQLAVSTSVDKSIINGPVEKLTYTVNYSNVGGTTANTVQLVSALNTGMTSCEYSTNGSTWTACSSAASSPPSHTFALGTLAAGATGTVYVRGDSPASPAVGLPLVSTSTLSAPSLTSATATASTTVRSASSGGTPSIVVTASSNKGSMGPSDTVTYTLTVVNAGTGAASNITVTDTVPATSWFHYVPGSIAGGNSRGVAGNDLSWTLTSLAVGESKTLTFQMSTDATGLPSGLTAVDNSARAADSVYCTGSPAPASCTSNTVTVLVDGNASLSLSLTASPTSPATVGPSDLITYTLVVGSTGSSTAHNVVLTSDLPSFTRFKSITSGTGTYDAANNRLVFALGDLTSGQTKQVVFVVEVDGSLSAGTTALTHTATASASDAQLRTASVTTNAVAEPVLVIEGSGPGSLPGPAAHVAASANASMTLTVDRSGLLQVGGYVSIGGSVAEVTAISGATVTLASPVTATAGTAVYRSASYALSFRNSGKASASSVVVSSVLPAGWRYVTASPAASSAPALGATGTVSWNLGSLPADFANSVQIVAVPTVSGTMAIAIADTRACTSSSTPGCSDSINTVVGGISVRKRTTTPVVSVSPAGGVATYGFTLENSLGTPVTGVAVTDPLPPGFTFKAGTASAAPSSVTDGLPTWTGLTVPANGQLDITFDVDVAALTGTGTYDNQLLVTGPAGVGITDFDALGTTDEDVTVLGAGSYVTAGYVFRDGAPFGTMSGADVGIAGVALTLDDGTANPPYQVQTDGYGYFRQIVTPGTWSIAIPSNAGDNTNLLAGLTLYNAYSNPLSLNASAPEASAIRFGFTGGATHQVDTVVGVGGNISPTAATVNDGATHAFTVTANPGYNIASVSGCGGSLLGSTFTTAPVTADCTVTATFSLKTYNVSTSAGTGGSISPTSAVVSHGSTTAFTVTPDAGYSIDSVSGCGGTLVGDTFTTAAVIGDCTVTASFTLNQYTVSTNAGAGGSISPSSATVNHGDTTSFTVTPDVGFQIVSVTGCGGSLAGNTFTTAAVTASCTVVATFAPIQYTVSTSAGSGGSISPSSATVNHGDTQSFTITPATGYSIQSVSGCGGTLVGTTFTTAAVTSNCTVTASFTLNQYTVSTSAGAGGSISPTSATVNHGGTTSFTVTPDTGYTVSSVSGCGGTLLGGVFTTGAVTGNCTVTASFSLKQYTVSTSAGTGGSISPSSATVNHGATQAFTVTPSPGYRIQSVSGCGGALAGNTFTTAAVTADCTVTASFESMPDRLLVTVNDPLVNACGESTLTVKLVDLNGAPVIPNAMSPISITLTASAPTGVARITQSGLDNPTGVGTAQATGQLPASGTATVKVSLDAAEVLQLAWASNDLPVTASSSPAQVTFQVGPVDASTSSVTAAGTQIFAGSGSVLVTVTPRDACGLLIGPGKPTTLAVPSGTLTPVQDKGDGTYTSSYSSAQGICPATPVQVTATVDGVVLQQKPLVTVLCAGLLASSPVEVLPVNGTLQACASKGEYARVKVTPLDINGVALPAGQTVTVVESPPFIISGGVETSTDPNTGAPTYTVLVGSNRCSKNGPSSIELRVAGMALSTHPMLDFACPAIGADGVTFQATPAVVPADGTTASTVQVSLVDTCGNPGFGRALTLRAFGGLPVTLSTESATAADHYGQPDDGTTSIEIRGAQAGATGLEVQVDGAWHQSAPELVTFVADEEGFYLGGRGVTLGCAVSGTRDSGAFGLFAWFVVASAWLFRKRQKGTLARSVQGVALVSALALGGSATVARAQGFDLQQMRPSPDPFSGGFSSLSARALSPGELNLTLLFNHANNPLVLYNDRNEQVATAVSAQSTLHLLGTVGVWKRIEIDFDLPFTVYQAGEALPLDAIPVIRQRAGLGDLRLAPKVQFLKHRVGNVDLAAAAAVDFYLPTGNGEGLQGSDFRVGPVLAFDATFSGGARLGTNLSYLHRSPRTFGGLFIANSFGYSVYGELPIIRSIRATVEVLGRVGDASQGRFHLPIEGLAGAKFFTSHVNVLAAVGAGVGRSYGTPDWRAMVALQIPIGQKREQEQVAQAAPPELTRAPPPAPEPPPAPPAPPPVVEKVEEPKRLVQFDAKKRMIALGDVVHFKTASAELAPESIPLLDDVAAVLGEHPEIRLVTIEGHTDNRGGHDYNVKLSRSRAAALKQYLIGKGIAPERLKAAGYGPDRPIASNLTSAGRAKNRRVVFNVDEVEVPEPQPRQ